MARAALLVIALTIAGFGSGPILSLKLRSRVQPFKGETVWKTVELRESVPASATAIVICDMWDNHWCSAAARRAGALAERMAPVIDRARAAGVRIIHSPSETMAFYQDAPQRLAMRKLDRVEPPAALDLPNPPLPIDDSKGGCDSDDKFYKAWTRQNARIQIAPGDFVSDDGREIYSLLQKEKIRLLLVMGVHTNMCVLNRSFAIKQMSKWGVRCVLVRDLTDSMYDPKYAPFVPHDEGTALVVEHIEKHWAPSMLSGDLLQALK